MEPLTFQQARERVWARVSTNETVDSGGRLRGLVDNSLNEIASRIYGAGDHYWKSARQASWSTTADQAYIALPWRFDALYLPTIWRTDGSGAFELTTDTHRFQNYEVANIGTTGKPALGMIAYDDSVGAIYGSAVWANSTAYAVHDIAQDGAGGSFYRCLAAHTSIAAANTFTTDRATNPTYWAQTWPQGHIVRIAPAADDAYAYVLDYRRRHVTLVGDNEFSGMPGEWMTTWLDGATAWAIHAVRGREAAERWFGLLPEFLRKPKTPQSAEYEPGDQPLSENTRDWRRTAGHNYGLPITGPT